MLIAFCGFSLWSMSDAMVHALEQYPTQLIAFFSASSSVFFLLLFSSKLGGIRETFARPKLKLRIFRGAVLSVSNFLAFYAFAHLDLTKAYALVFVTPLLAKMLSVVMLKERIPAIAWILSIIGFAGVLVVLRPGLVELDPGSLAALATCFFFSLGYVLARYIGEENQTPLSMALFQYVILIVVLGIPVTGMLQDMTLPLQPLMLCAAIGFTSALGSICVATGYARAPSAYVAPIHYTQIFWGAFYGALLYHEYPDIWTAAGAVIIIGAGLALVKAGQRA